MLALPTLVLLLSTAAPGEAPPPASGSVVPTQALMEKIGQGDRLYLAGDYRLALFEYQDAIHMQPRYAPAHVRLGRTYLAMRYPLQAISQAEEALAEEPENAEARKLLDEAKAAAAKLPQPPPAAAPATAAAAPEPSSPKPGPRIYKLSPDGGAPAARPAGAPAAAASAPAGGGASAGAAAAAPVAIVAVAPTPETRHETPADPSAAAVTPAQAQVAAQHYRTALGLLQNRDWAKAVAELSDAILANPKLAVAYSARGSAQFGLGKYREAAEDYRTATQLDPKLGTPVYGLAECYRVLGDGKKAAEMYGQYARSTAPDVRDDLRALAAKRAEELR
jgi:tetratricopeptide (TPR) repeat protein